MPMAAMSAARSPACASAVRATSSWLAQISRGSCSTQPGLREDLRELLLRARPDRAVVVKQDRARTGGALIQCEDEGLNHRTRGARRRPAQPGRPVLLRASATSAFSSGRSSAFWAMARYLPALLVSPDSDNSSP